MSGSDGTSGLTELAMTRVQGSSGRRAGVPARFGLEPLDIRPRRVLFDNVEAISHRGNAMSVAKTKERQGVAAEGPAATLAELRRQLAEKRFAETGLVLEAGDGEAAAIRLGPGQGRRCRCLGEAGGPF
jgi:hypothetical protein